MWGMCVSVQGWQKRVSDLFQGVIGDCELWSVGAEIWTWSSGIATSALNH